MINIFKKVSPKRSLVISIAISICYFMVYYFHNTEFIRSYFEDKAFDTLLNPPIVSFLGYSSLQQSIDNAPNTIVLELDNKFLLQKNLIDENNESSYGYLFPRGELADLINKLDTKSHELNLKAVFLDYDLTYTLMPGGKEFSDDDKKLLQILSKNRNYKILIPITARQNIYYENLKNNPSIIPVSVSFSESSDGISRRLISNENNIPAASLSMYAIASNQKIKIKGDTLFVGAANFKKQDIIGNRIISKTILKNSGYYQSKWFNMDIVSASMLDNLDYGNAEIKYGTYLFTGAAYNYSNDILNTNVDNIFGIEAHANAFMTQCYLNGPLKPLPVTYAILLVFCLSFIFNYIFDFPNSFSPTAKKELIFSFTAVLIIMTGVMYGISYWLLYAQKLWFNWSVPLALFALFEGIDMIIKLITQYRYNKKQR
ncbi:CHASE2 domain-containing protein [Sulfuricurvum sp.]|uniref:CHASE2 domain-containing protein n=1 Tax=Sulfuricurvum sp. TaxID=2025608 RepID=UPI003BB7698F